MLDALVQDTRYALRWLVRSPGFAIVAILSLGVGIGCNTAIFAVVDALLLRPLPVREPSRLVDLYTSGADGDTYSTNSLPDIARLPRAEGRVRGRRRLLAHVRRGQPRRPGAAGARRGRHRQLLHDARCPGAPRPHAPRRRRRARRAAHGGAVEPILAARVRRRTVSRRTHAPDSWAGVHGRRRARRRLHWHGADARAGNLGPRALCGGGRAGGHQRDRAVADGLVAARSPRAALAVRQGAPGRPGVGRAGTRQRRCRRRAPARRASADEQGPSRHGAADRRHASPSRGGQDARLARHGDDARRRPRAGHRLRQRRRHAARARRGASARDCHPPRGRRRVAAGWCGSC